MPKELAHITILIAIILQTSYCIDTEEFRTVGINLLKLSKIEHGTELVFIEDGYNEKSSYRLEDFFWTGSGDGESEGDNQIHTATEYQTKTVLSTIYVETPSTHLNQTFHGQTTNCPFNCEGTVTATEDIVPTPTFDVIYKNTSNENASDADRYFWLLTVLKGEGKHIVITELKNSLAKLYKIAFQRQQEYHLGITNRPKREIAAETDKSVNVYIYNVAKSPINGEQKIEVLYHVSVSGQPVAATTAAADMNLVSDEEVIQELGYPFIIKAEPYLKVSDPQYLSSSNNTWVFIGVALSILFVLLLLVALLTLAFSKQTKTQTTLPNKVYHHDVNVGQSNKGFENTEYKSGRRNKEPSTYINFRTHSSNETLNSGMLLNRPLHSSSSSSSVSVSSLDVSPPSGTKKKIRTPKRIDTTTRPKAAVNRIPLVQERRPSLVLDSDSSSDKSKRDIPDTIFIDSYDPGVISPKSYLSMPSVKAFPRGNIPEPLNKVLEPVSVLHLDIEDDDVLESQYKSYHHPRLTRHGSLSAIEDPGIIGPVVWSGYCEKLHHGNSADELTKAQNNATRMRKRFHELLDDTFSLFGSQRCSPVKDNRPIPVEVKSHSAKRPIAEENRTNLPPRPKTAVQRRPVQSSSEGPRGAWATNAPSPLSRPLSAGPFIRSNITPEIDVERVLTDGVLSPNDPAVPLIAAIKTELNRCSLPGSTTNLVD